MTDSHSAVKYTVDAVAAGVTVATFVKWLPPIAAAFSIIWTGIQIYEWYNKKHKGRK